MYKVYFLKKKSNKLFARCGMKDTQVWPPVHRRTQTSRFYEHIGNIKATIS